MDTTSIGVSARGRGDLRVTIEPPDAGRLAQLVPWIWAELGEDRIVELVLDATQIRITLRRGALPSYEELGAAQAQIMRQLIAWITRLNREGRS